MLTAVASQTGFTVIPSLDLLGGRSVRLLHGEFNSVTDYGDPLNVLDAWDIAAGSIVHVVDLDGARSGESIHHETVREMTRRGYRVQIGGGIRSLDSAARWIDAGANRLVLGTISSEDPAMLQKIVSRFGPERVVSGIDVRDGRIRVKGWQVSSTGKVHEVFDRLLSLGIGEILVTQIGRDGTMQGPDLDFYRRFLESCPFAVQASGGVGTLGDIAALSRIELSGVIIGRALHEKRFELREANEYASGVSGVNHRVIPCLDIRDGRVVKGVRFASLRDAGDPVEAALRYESEGADELIILDISATAEERATSIETVRRVADSLFIPLTVGGGVRTLDDFGALLRSGADRVAINTAAVARPDLLKEVASEYGVQAVVLSCDAKREGEDFFVVTHAGRSSTKLTASEWCRRAEELGAGEVLLTSIDRDGTRSGYDVELLRSVSGAVRIGVIASGGAGNADHMREAIDRGGARAVLAASLFHDGGLSIRAAKEHLARHNISVRNAHGAAQLIETGVVPC